MRDSKLVVGYIGNGKSTNRYHLPFVLKRPDTFVVKSIWMRDLSHMKWDVIEGINYTDDLEGMLNDPEIDLIVVCTPVLHYEYTKMVLEHGKHCLCEKPFTDTYAQAKELFDLADEKGLYCSAYQNRRYDSDFLTAQKVIESGVLGDILEVEMGFDYYRPEVPLSVTTFNPYHSYLYGHACHTFDQVISYWGKPDRVHYDVRQLLGEGRYNDYFDVDMYYGVTKVSVKSSYFRVKARPSFIVYGTKGMFEHYHKDRQEEHLKMFYMPDHADFGVDTPDRYGTVIYYDDDGAYHEEKVVSEVGDYARVYDGIYDCIVLGKPQVITHEQTLIQMEMLEEGIKMCH